MKNKMKFWLGILVSIVLLYFFFRDIDFDKVSQILLNVSFPLIIFSASLQLIAQSIRAERWRILVRPVKEIEFKAMFSITMIGLMSNNIFPARMGEFIKAYLLGHQEKISKSTSLATVVVERLFDGLTIVVMMVAVILFFPFPDNVSKDSLLNSDSLWMICLVTTSFYVGVLLFLMFIKYKEDLVKKFFQVTIGKLFPKKADILVEKMEVMISSFSEGLHFINSKEILMKISVYSLIIWLLIAGSFYTCFLAFGMSLSYFTGILFTVIVAVAVMVPSSPGFVGTFHYSSQLVLLMMGIGVNLATSFSLLMHLVGYIPVTVIGLYFVFRNQISLTSLQHIEQ